MLGDNTKMLPKLKFLALACISAFFMYTFLFMTLIPVWFYRLLVKLLVKVTNPKCGKILTGISSCFAGPNPYKNSLMTISPYILLSEKVDMRHVKEVFNEKIIQANIYPEVKQRIVTKFGYTFWQNVDNFDLDNHIKYLYPNCPNKPLLISDIRGEVGDSVVFRQFDKQQSPWELFVAPNVFDPDNPKVKSAIFFRFHHCLMDGLSCAKFLQKTASKPWNWPICKTLTKSQNKRGTINSLLLVLELALTGPYHAVDSFIMTNDSSEFIETALKIPKSKEEAVAWGTRNKCTPRRVDVKRLDKIKEKYNVGVSSVVTTIVIEGVAKFIKTRCHSGFAKVPEEIVTHFVVPLPGHPEAELANRWSMIRLPIKLSECVNPSLTVKWIHQYFRKLASSVVPIANYMVFSVLALYPVFLRPDLNNSKLRQTILLSNFPGPKEDTDVFGYTAVDWSTLGSTPAGSAIVVMPQTLSGKFWIEAGGTNVLFSQQEDLILIEDCLHSILDELETQKP